MVQKKLKKSSAHMPAHVRVFLSGMLSIARNKTFFPHGLPEAIVWEESFVLDEKLNPPPWCTPEITP